MQTTTFHFKDEYTIDDLKYFISSKGFKQDRLKSGGRSEILERFSREVGGKKCKIRFLHSYRNSTFTFDLYISYCSRILKLDDLSPEEISKQFERLTLTKL